VITSTGRTVTTSSGSTYNVRNFVVTYTTDDDAMAGSGVPRQPEPPSDPYPDAIEVPFRIVEPVNAVAVRRDD
jgi:hypothetical protein